MSSELIPFINGAIAENELDPIKKLIISLTENIETVSNESNYENYSRYGARSMMINVRYAMLSAADKMQEEIDQWQACPPPTTQELSRQYQWYDANKQSQKFKYHYIHDICQKSYTVSTSAMDACKQAMIDAVWLHRVLNTGVKVQKIKADKDSFVNQMKKFDREQAWDTQETLPTKEDGIRYNFMIRMAKQLERAYTAQHPQRDFSRGPAAAAATAAKKEKKK